MIPYTDIHSHHPPSPGVLAIRNLLNPDTVEAGLAEEGLYSIGIHPWHIHPDHWKEDAAHLRAFIHHPKVLAIGEAGLDRLTDLPLSLQEEVFSAMVQLSEEAKKPLIIHAVRTHHEIAMLHRALQPTQRWIVHGFNVRMSIAQGLLQHGLCLSFGEALLKQGSPASEVLQQMPLEQLFIESDDKTADVPSLYRRAAQLRDMDPEVLKEDMYKRFCSMFGYA
ncbi:MAG: TatD family hydrolase [Bacteroidia bacterium]|nr:TatD family hydrolase [Bacteroidia bacterium]